MFTLSMYACLAGCTRQWLLRRRFTYKKKWREREMRRRRESERDKTNAIERRERNERREDEKNQQNWMFISQLIFTRRSGYVVCLFISSVYFCYRFPNRQQKFTPNEWNNNKKTRICNRLFFCLHHHFHQQFFFVNFDSRNQCKQTINSICKCLKWNLLALYSIWIHCRNNKKKQFILFRLISIEAKSLDKWNPNNSGKNINCAPSMWLTQWKKSHNWRDFFNNVGAPFSPIVIFRITLGDREYHR